MPVISSAGLKPHYRCEDGGRLLRGLDQISRYGSAREMGRIHGLLSLKGLRPWCDFHLFSLVPTDFALVDQTALGVAARQITQVVDLASFGQER